MLEWLYIAFVPSITIRDIPEALLARLRSDAKRERRSLNSEIIVQLERSVQQDDHLYPTRARRQQALAQLLDRAATRRPVAFTADELDRDIETMFDGPENDFTQE